MRINYLKLKPNIDPSVKEFIDSQKELLFSFISSFGSPLHIIFPNIFAKNIRLYKQIFKKNGVSGKVYYAFKANKALSFLEVAAQQGIGVEVSSLFELRLALSHGITGSSIAASGPSKSDRFLLLSLQNKCLISIDSVEELTRLISLTKYLSNNEEEVSILLRMSSLTGESSKFGIQQTQLEHVYALLRNHLKIHCCGFSFHLNNYSIKDRIQVINILIDEIRKAKKKGLNFDTIDIGGGFTINYLKKGAWQKFLKRKEKENIFLGMKNFASFYPYWSEFPKQEFFNKILLSESKDKEENIKDMLRRENIQLFIEPGRSLLDQCGFTLMRVQSTKTHSADGNLILVDANINHLSEQWFNSDFLIDPLLISWRGNKVKIPFVASIGGNLCLERDMLTWRKVTFDYRPDKNDMLVYLNAAGYQMDSNESTFCHIPIPTKVTVYKKRGNWHWKLDDQFSQLDLA